MGDILDRRESGRGKDVGPCGDDVQVQQLLWPWAKISLVQLPSDILGVLQ
jgi:hypothetical protein